MSSYTAGTFVAKPSYISKGWFLIDASSQYLGRMASRVALLLRGKHKPYYTPNINCGDSVIIINASKIITTGKKLASNKFFWHTGHPGGIKCRSWNEILNGKHPERLVRKAIERMMPKDSPLARKQMKSLYVYSNDDHPHRGQNPSKIDLS